VYLGPLEEGTGSHKGLIQAKYAKLPSSPLHRSKVFPKELRKEANTESQVNPGPNS